MLKNISPLLNADVLYALRAMGHGDQLALVDSNFPADSDASQTTFGRLLRIDASVTDAAKAILSLMPLDSFIDDAAIRMEVVGDAATVQPVQNEIQAIIDDAESEKFTLTSLERFEFYERAKTSYCVIATSERRFYGCFLLSKGVFPPEHRFVD